MWQTREFRSEERIGEETGRFDRPTCRSAHAERLMGAAPEVAAGSARTRVVSEPRRAMATDPASDELTTGPTPARSARVVRRASRPRADDAERELMQRIASQDLRAFEELYRIYAPRLGAFLSRQLRQRDLVEECFDDVMLVVWQKADRFDPTKRVSTWLFGIAQNKARKALEKRSRQPDRPGSEPHDEVDVAGAIDADFEGTLLRRDELQVLCRAIEALPPTQRAVLELTFSEGCSYAEIGEIAGISVNTVKTRMFHARKRLIKALPGLFKG